MAENITARRSARIPFYAAAKIQAEDVLIPAQTVNLSKEGLGLTGQAEAIDSARRSGALQIGRLHAVTIRMPNSHEKLVLQAELVWAGPSSRALKGSHTVDMGMRFDLTSDRVALAKAATIVETFRYGVAVLTHDESETITQALGSTYNVIPIRDASDFAKVESGHLGLIVCHAPAMTPALESELKAILDTTNNLSLPPIAYFGTTPSPWLEAVIASGKVLYQPFDLNPLQLGSLTRRLIGSHMLMLENERLTEELNGRIEQLRRENEIYRLQTPRSQGGLDNMLGQSPVMRDLFNELEHLAKHDVGVLILGETGTGKSRAARAIHTMSSRAEHAFVAQNCAAVAETLLDSELFGHSKGSFTGATQDRDGLFVAASKGTIFLDEVADMSKSMQAKLLHVLETGEVRRVGDNRTYPVDLRIICATLKDLPKMVATGEFREDLYYRLSGYVVHMPALRDRKSDIAEMAFTFMTEAAERFKKDPPHLTTDAIASLEAHAWPGNIRQLRQCIERLVLTCSPDGKINHAAVQRVLQVDAKRTATLSDQEPFSAAFSWDRSLDESRAAFEKAIIEQALEKCGGVMAQAARLLKTDRTTLLRRCQRLDIRTGGDS